MSFQGPMDPLKKGEPNSVGKHSGKRRIPKDPPKVSEKYPAWLCQVIATENDPVEIVDLPS